MSVKLEKCVGSKYASAGTTTYRLVSLSAERVAFKARIPESHSCEIYPSEGFIDSGEMVTLTISTSQLPSAKLMVKWTEVPDGLDNVDLAMRRRIGRSGNIIHPLRLKNTYTEKQYPSALLKTYDDPWSEERRPWLLLKSGYETLAARDEDLIWNAVEKIINELAKCSVHLEICPMYYSLSCTIKKEVASEIRYNLKPAESKIFPVLFLIDDHPDNGKFTDFIKYYFSADFYIFALSGQELVDIATSNADRPYPQLRNWCSEFAGLIGDSEEGYHSSESNTNSGDDYYGRKLSRGINNYDLLYAGNRHNAETYHERDRHNTESHHERDRLNAETYPEREYIDDRRGDEGSYNERKYSSRRYQDREPSCIRKNTHDSYPSNVRESSTEYLHEQEPGNAFRKYSNVSPSSYKKCSRVESGIFNVDEEELDNLPSRKYSSVHRPACRTTGNRVESGVVSIDDEELDNAPFKKYSTVSRSSLRKNSRIESEIHKRSCSSHHDLSTNDLREERLLEDEAPESYSEYDARGRREESPDNGRDEHLAGKSDNDRNDVGDETEDRDRCERGEIIQKEPSPDQAIATACDIDLALDYVRENSEDPSIASYVAVPYLFNRLESPFEDLRTNINVMRLMYIACSVDCIGEEYEKASFDIVKSLISSGYIQKVCTWFGSPAVDDSSLWSDDLCEFLVSVMNLFVVIAEYKIRSDEIVDAWRKFLNLLNALPLNFWRQVPARYWLEEKAERLEHLGSSRDRIGKKKSSISPAVRDSPFRTKEENKTVNSPDFTFEDIFAPALWEECEKRKPPFDYRELCEIPVIKDIHNTEAPYLRRAIIDGHYENAAHYLDVLFRLFREDLISPLRDGLAVYKLNGSTRYQRLVEDDNQPSSDLLIFDTVGIEGVQVRSSDGTLFRYAKLSEESRSHPALSRNLMFGQLVCLSCDGFQEDLHLAKVVERKETENTGIVALTFMNEDNTIKKGRSYKIAEPQSYLVAYQYVLLALKDISPYSPIAFERYIVYGKCDVRKPLYMRIEEDVEDIVSDVEIRKYYEDLRKETRLKLSQNSEEFSEIEDELNTSLTKKKVGVINAHELERIKIKDAVHELDKLDNADVFPDLDDSQRQAAIQALTNELAIIQGPPGTGKTFIGVEIARIMLHNRDRWGITEPMLVMAYTNTALDQFAEKLLKEAHFDIDKGYFKHEFPIAARLGSKSESELMKSARFMKKDVINDWSIDLNTDSILKEAETAQRNKREAREKLSDAACVLCVYKRDLIGYKALAKVIPEKFKTELNGWKMSHRDSSGCELDNDEALACWLLDKAYTKDDDAMDLPTISDDELYLPEDLPSDDEEESAPIEKLLEDVNRLALNEEDQDQADDFYLTERVWDIVRDSPSMSHVVLFHNKFKDFSGNLRRTHDSLITMECGEIREAILKVKPMTSEDVEDVKHIFSLAKQRRWELYVYWMDRLQESTRLLLPALTENYQSACDKVKDAMLNKDAEVLKKCLFICATTTGAAKEIELLTRIQCRVIFVEEAAEVLEAHILASLMPSVEHMVLIGDHQQLRPNPCVYDLARDYHLDVSLFERLVRNGFPYTTLQVQHRMNTAITENIIRPFFYPKIVDDAIVLEYPNVPGMDKNCFFWMHDAKESTTPIATSRWNEYEVHMVVALINYLRKQGIEFNEMTVIAAYSAQMMALREAIGITFGRLREDQSAVSVQTVDSYQGKENRIIIVSLVRSELDGIGFLAVKNRITVALTRAKHGMYVVGNFGYLSHCSSFWDKICNKMFDNDLINTALKIKCKTHGNVQEIESPSDFAEKSPEGGCQEICGTALACGHDCPRRCHPIDDHEGYPCLQPCLKRCKQELYRHQCQRQCYEDCGPCMHVVTVSLDCGHLTNVVCSSIATAVCGERCSKKLCCGHRCSNQCGKPCTIMCQEPVNLSGKECKHTWSVPCCESRLNLDCPKICGKMLECGHTCAELCGKPCTTYCKAEVTRRLRCGHPITMACSEDETTQKCETPILRDLERCGHSVLIPCHAGMDSSYCVAFCGKKLPCGHQCLKECGECFRSGGCKCDSVCGKVLPCGHKCTKKCGVQCEPCISPCLSRCKHQYCGSGGSIQEISYGRNCSQPCVLCPHMCDNSCQHRSCGKRCYEVCDVKPCEQPCTQRLMCGHGCLGMCGETCPSICGTCRKQSYLALIKEYLGVFEALSKLPRLIEVDGCHHVFPVEYLDKHFSSSQEQCSIPSCPFPDCDKPLAGIQRYLRQIKKRNLEKYQQRITSTLTLSENSRGKLMNGCLNIIQKELKESKKVQQIATVRHVPKSDVEVVNNIVELINDAEKSLSEERLKNNDLYNFWMGYTKFVVVLSRLSYSFVNLARVRVTKTTPPLIGSILLLLIPGGRIHGAFGREMKELCGWLRNYGGTRLTGVLVPRARFLAVRSIFLNDLMVLCKHCHWEARDLPNKEVADAIFSCARKFMEATPEKNYLSILDEFEQLMVNALKKNGLDGKFQTREQLKLEIPEF